MRKILVVATLFLGTLSGQGQEKVMDVRKTNGTSTRTPVADLRQISFLNAEDTTMITRLTNGAIFRTDVNEVEAFVKYLFDNTAFTSEEKIREKIKSYDDLLEDPAMMVYLAIVGAAQKFAPAMNASAGPIAEGSKAFTKGLMEWKAGEPSYPDANSTMRLTYGTVKSYSPQDGVIYKHYTTLKGVIEKENNDDYEFRVPARLHEIYVNKDYGQYANEKGELPACFLINCDITGGNSGSPVMDADGNLIGLAFDGNWESMSSDVMFEPDLQRCICVDIRYVLLLLDKFGGAGYLLNEMNIIR